ncbi:glycosyltransferase family 4 protein [Methanobacterium sp.]|jgi:glycosyltransferase involved in cell wall biosynthesis|uniref:glycosyltransferase family 4 protein n=1 Tax=Methanobacterium sp. TaxID=2164 RepID=UPI003159442F
MIQLKNGKTNKKSKILMVISYPDTRLRKEIDTLLKCGYEVKVIIWERGWPFTCDKKVDVKGLGLNAPIGRINSLLYFPIWFLYLFFWLFKSEWDVVHAVNFDTYLFSLIAAKIKNKPIIYDIYDFYGDMMPSILRNIIVKVDKRLLPFSDVLILADEARVEQIGGSIHKNIFTINNSPEEDNFDKNYRDDNINTFKVFIGGKILKERCLDVVISAIGKIEGAKLSIRGHCDETDYKQQIIRLSQKFDNIDIYLDGVPYEEIVKGTLSADLTIALYDPDIPNNKYASPNKLFEAMASKIPIIVNENTSMADIVRKEKCGMVIPYGNEEALIWAVSRLKNDLSLQKRLGDNGRKAYENKYNWTIMENRLNSIYCQVLDGGF